MCEGEWFGRRRIGGRIWSDGSTKHWGRRKTRPTLEAQGVEFGSVRKIPPTWTKRKMEWENRGGRPVQLAERQQLPPKSPSLAVGFFPTEDLKYARILLWSPRLHPPTREGPVREKQTGGY